MGCDSCKKDCKPMSTFMVGRLEVNKREIKRPTDGYVIGSKVELPTGETGVIEDTSQWHRLGIHVDQIHARRYFEPQWVTVISVPEEDPQEEKRSIFERYQQG